MHPRLLSFFLFSLYLILLILPIHSLPATPSNPSQTHVSFTPLTKHAIRSIETLLALCCRDARLVSHNRLTLNQRNTLTLPLTQQRTLQSFRSLLPNLPNFQISSPSHSDHTNNNPHLIARQRASRSKSPSTRFYTEYHTLDVLEHKWAQLARRYDAVSISQIGQSIEGRPITLLTIGATDSDNPKRILINALQHAREWIAAAAATFIAEKLAINSSPDAGGEDTELQRLLRSVEVLVVPVVNPDGYVYTHTSDPDNVARYWRKNRRPLSGPCTDSDNDIVAESQTPIGVDLNRNWPVDFGGPLLTSKNPCGDTYTGTSPFSEPETKALSELITKTKGIMTHIDFHSYGQIILGPWASSEETPDRVCDYEAVGNEMAKAMFGSSGSQYMYGSGPKLRNGAFAASGVITDWVHDTFPQTLSFAIELRPRDPHLGEKGFELSTDQIVPTSNEAFSAVRVLLSFSNDPEGFLSSFETFNKCRSTTTVQKTPPSESSSKTGLIAGAAVGGVLAVFVLCICIMVFRIKRRRSKEKQIEEANAAPSDDGANEGGSLESVCAVVKRLDTNRQSRPEKDPTISECEVPAQSPAQSEVLSTVSNECITLLGADESASAWSNLDGESSYGNTVLLDAQNPYFPGGTAAMRTSRPDS